MGLTIGISGVGKFGGRFAQLFQAHPLVDRVYLADLNPDTLKNVASQLGIVDTFTSHEDLCESDCDAIAIFTLRWLHGPQAIKALRAGKHVYSAVPIGVTLDEIREIVQLVEQSELLYMLGETSYYYPATIYCRQRYQAGDFGHFVYGEAGYYHDMSHGFYEVFKRGGGDQWKSHAGFPPMLYPTHSVSMITSVTGSRMTQVSCLGYVDRNEDGVFRADANLWGNVFSNETALFRTSDGGMARINEFRRIGVGAVRMSMHGTEACYEEQDGARAWVNRHGERQDLFDLLACETAVVAEEDRHLHATLQSDYHSGLAPIHPAKRLPAELRYLPNGHEGSHHFLVDDFCRACTTHKLPPNHVWAAARYCVPGIIAHESAKLDGALLDIPDLGDPPDGWDRLSF